MHLILTLTTRPNPGIDDCAFCPQVPHPDPPKPNCDTCRGYECPPECSSESISIETKERSIIGGGSWSTRRPLEPKPPGPFPPEPKLPKPRLPVIPSLESCEGCPGRFNCPSYCKPLEPKPPGQYPPKPKPPGPFPPEPKPTIEDDSCENCFGQNCLPRYIIEPSPPLTPPRPRPTPPRPRPTPPRLTPPLRPRPTPPRPTPPPRLPTERPKPGVWGR